MADVTLSEVQAKAPTAGTSAPRVTIGLAVYNGENFLAESIDSLLSQSFSDLELVVCDNDSDDRTEEICRSYAARDDRVRYYRNPDNIGGVRNENRTYFLARGEYFKLAAHDDLISPTFIEECLRELESDRSAVVCAPRVEVIDQAGRPIEHLAPIAGTETTAHDRFRAISDRQYMCEAIYGLIRTDALREVRPQSNHLHSDRIVLCELAVSRPFRIAETAVLYRRLHAENQTKDCRGRMAWFQPELKDTGAVRLPHWLQLMDYVFLLARSPLGWTERTRCAVEVGRWSWDLRRSLAMDLLDALGMLLRGKRRRRDRYRDESRWL